MTKTLSMHNKLTKLNFTTLYSSLSGLFVQQVTDSNFQYHLSQYFKCKRSKICYAKATIEILALFSRQ